MAIAQRLIKQVDGLETLRVLLETKKEDVIAVHEEARKQIALTQADEDKLMAAKAIIAQAGQIKSDIQNERDALQNSKDNYSKQVESDSDNIKEKNRQVDVILNAAQSEQLLLDESIKRHEEDKAIFQKEKLEHIATIKLREDAVQKKEQENNRIAEALDAEGARLARTRSALIQKTNLIAQAQALQIEG